MKPEGSRDVEVLVSLFREISKYYENMGGDDSSAHLLGWVIPNYLDNLQNDLVGLGDQRKSIDIVLRYLAQVERRIIPLQQNGKTD